MKIAVLGPGGVGGLLAAVLARPSLDADGARGEDRAADETLVVARESTAEEIAAHGIRVSSVTFGELVAHPRALSHLREPVNALIFATKAAGLGAALERVEVDPPLVLPLLNGLDHLALLRERFDPSSVLAGSIRVEADRPRPGVVVHTSSFLVIDMASEAPAMQAPMRALAQVLQAAGVPVRVLGTEAQVMWSKLVRLNALACTTSAYDVQLGEIRSTPALRADLVGAIEEACAVGRAEGADVQPETAIAELELAHDSLGSSMQRDIAAGRAPELDAIPGSVLRAGARHGIACPTIEKLVGLIRERVAASVSG